MDGTTEATGSLRRRSELAETERKFRAFLDALRWG